MKNLFSFAFIFVDSFLSQYYINNIDYRAVSFYFFRAMLSLCKIRHSFGCNHLLTRRALIIQNFFYVEFLINADANEFRYNCKSKFIQHKTVCTDCSVCECTCVFTWGINISRCRHR